MNTPKLILSIALLLQFNSLFAQDKKQRDKDAIKQMCGCFEVTFNFTETFNYSTDSLYQPSESKTSRGLEWAFPVAETDDKIVIQHILLVGNPEKPGIVKHWRQDWIYENTDLYVFDKNNSWLYQSLPEEQVNGQWTQKVFQVDDSPRYEGSASWVHVDGKSFWENSTPAPLPRREYTKRNDYNVTLRANRHEITENGWIHDQDNAKIIREDNARDVVLAREKGLNEYMRVPNERCAAAVSWWTKNEDKWALVRSKWEEVFNRKSNLKLKGEVDGKVLFKHLFEEGYDNAESIGKLIESFIENESGSLGKGQ